MLRNLIYYTSGSNSQGKAQNQINDDHTCRVGTNKKICIKKKKSDDDVKDDYDTSVGYCPLLVM